MTQQTFRLPETDHSPSLFIRRQPAAGAPVLYVHGATFPSALSVGFDFGDGSWLDDWNARGFDAWAFDFGSFGESGRYAAMSEPADRHPPLGRAPDAARQVAAVVALIRRETGRRVSLVAHSWGGAPASLATIAEPDAIDRLVLFAPIVRRSGGTPSSLPAWSDVSNEAQYARFVEDVPEGHAPVLEGFDRWGAAYLASDPDAGKRAPPAVRIPNGPRADNVDTWAGRLVWDPARITRPIAIVRGAWDSLCRDADAATILDAATAAPSCHDARLDGGTHLMHLETGRHRLYEAVGRVLRGEQP
ncbi:MAG: alpha/beta hydrolase [Proteobacteria bacterium]|nr:alpha/beta hydrolase [Pseudomonadota bacterium]